MVSQGLTIYDTLRRSVSPSSPAIAEAPAPAPAPAAVGQGEEPGPTGLSPR